VGQSLHDRVQIDLFQSFPNEGGGDQSLFWNRLRGPAWHSAVEDGFVPVAAGLILAGAFAIPDSGGTDPLAGGIALGVAACRLWRPNFRPLILLGLGASIFAFERAIVY
jgi:hypothetical protein